MAARTKGAVSQKEFKEMKGAMQAVIDRKEAEIAKLKEENLLLLKTALKRSGESERLKVLLDSMEERSRVAHPKGKKKDL